MRTINSIEDFDGLDPDDIDTIHLARRVSWVLHRSPIPPDHAVLATCGEERCVNPGHLYLSACIFADVMSATSEGGAH
jgi:hypothetical protein